MFSRNPIRNVPTQIVPPLTVMPIRTEPVIISSEFGKNGNAPSTYKSQQPQKIQWEPSHGEIMHIMDQQKRFEEHMRRQQQLFMQYGQMEEPNRAPIAYQESKATQREFLSPNGQGWTLDCSKATHINNYPTHQAQLPMSIESFLPTSPPVNPLQQKLPETVTKVFPAFYEQQQQFHLDFTRKGSYERHLRDIAAQARRSAKFEALLQQEKLASHPETPLLPWAETSIQQQRYQPYGDGLKHGLQNGSMRNFANTAKWKQQFGEKASTSVNPNNSEFLPHSAMQQTSPVFIPLSQMGTSSANQILPSQVPPSSIGLKQQQQQSDEAADRSKGLFRPYTLLANEKSTRKRKRDDTDPETLQHGNIPKLFALNETFRSTAPQMIPCPSTHLRIFDKEFYTRVLYQQMQTFQHLRHPTLYKQTALTGTPAFFDRRMQYPET